MTRYCKGNVKFAENFRNKISYRDVVNISSTYQLLRSEIMYYLYLYYYYLNPVDNQLCGNRKCPSRSFNANAAKKSIKRVQGRMYYES